MSLNLCHQSKHWSQFRSSHREVFLRKGVLKICGKFTGGHPCRGVISIKLQSNFIEITLWEGSSPVNLLNIFRSTFPRNTSGWLFLPVPFDDIKCQSITDDLPPKTESIFFIVWRFLLGSCSSTRTISHRSTGEKLLGGQSYNFPKKIYFIKTCSRYGRRLTFCHVFLPTS